MERKDTDSYNSSCTSGAQQQHPPPLLPLPTPPHPFPPSSSAGVPGSGAVSIATPAHLPDSTTDSWSGYYSAQRQDGVNKPFSNKSVSLKQRCRDYDGRSLFTISEPRVCSISTARCCYGNIFVLTIIFSDTTWSVESLLWLLSRFP